MIPSRIAALGLLLALPGCAGVAVPGFPASSASYGYAAPLQPSTPALAAASSPPGPAAPAAPVELPVIPERVETPQAAVYDHWTDPVIAAVVRPAAAPIPAGTPDGQPQPLPAAPTLRIVDLAGVHAGLAAAAD